MIKTEALLGKLFEDSKSILLVTDELFNIRYISSSVEFAFGVNPYAVLGRNAFDFVTECNRENWRQCLDDAHGNKSSEIKLIAPGGKELYFDVTVRNHVAHDEIRGMVVIMHDITERRRKHRDLEKTNDQLDHFIFKTIHDLRAPIHSAMGLIELTLQSSMEEREKYISLIKCNLQRIESFIDDVSSFYKNEKLAVMKEKIDFGAIFYQEKEFLQNLPGAHEINMEYQFEGSCDLFSDPLRLRTILTNILSNAIKYSDPSKSHRYIRLAVSVDESECCIEIQDNGVGIDDQYLSKIFEIFFRVETKLPGTGLGLYIVSDTVKRLQGNISVKSIIGAGTTFIITLPNFAESPVSLN